MIPILDWIFEGIVNWVASVVSQLFDAVSGLFLEALGTDMTAMEEYFPFVTKAYDVMQVTAWAILILITIWQLFLEHSEGLLQKPKTLGICWSGVLSTAF